MNGPKYNINSIITSEDTTLQQLYPYGYHLVKRMGWSPGTSLGRNNQGIKVPISHNHIKKDKITHIVLYNLNPYINCSRILTITKTLNTQQTKPKHTIPHINVKIGSTELVALIDSGSEISCMDQSVFEQLTQKHTFPTLPLSNFHVRGAMGQKSSRISIQILIDLLIGDITTSVVLLVVNNLIRPLILGFDWFDEYKAIINFSEKCVNVTVATDTYKLPFMTSTLQTTTLPESQTTCSIMHISSDDTNLMEPIESLYTIINNLSFSQDIKSQLTKILQTHWRVFNTKPGLTDKYIHHIRLHTEKPFIKKQYPIPLSLRPDVDKTVTQLEQDGIITRIASPYANPITAVKKKDGTIRLCLDARYINNLMEADSESPPRIHDILQQLTGCTIFTIIDLRASFWQIPLDPDSRKYTSFLHNGHSYAFTVMPFGIKTATASFSRAMDIILGSEVREYAFNYVDDLLIASPSITQHLGHINAVLERLKEANMTINLAKTQFCTTKIKFLGHILTPEGILPDPEKVECIRNFPAPQNIKELRGFLGLCNYYRRFANFYSNITKPLTELLKKNKKWCWAKTEQDAFSSTKDIFINKLVLHHPDSSQIQIALDMP